MTVVRESEGVDDGVEMNCSEREGGPEDEDGETSEDEGERWCREETLQDFGDSWEGERPGEEEQVRPNVEHLGGVDCGDMVGLVAF